MSYKFFIAGVEVQCDTLEELLEAVGNRVVDPVASQKVGLSDHAEAYLESPEGENASEDVDKPQKGSKKTQGSGPQKAWQEAREYAAEHGLTAMEARAILSKRRKEAVQKALESLGGS